MPQLIAGGMEGECKQIQRQQQIGQALMSVSEVVLHMIAVVFRQVKGFIFDFPSSPARRCELLDIVTVDLQIGDETIAVGDFGISFSNNLNR